MISRRLFLQTSAGLIALGPASLDALARQRRAAPPLLPHGRAFLEGSPINPGVNTAQNVLIDGVPFWNDMSGDRFAGLGHPPFPVLGEWIGYGNPPPAPTEKAEIVVVGGGLGGLCSAYLLRHRDLVLLEHNSRFGGAAQAESWDGLAYSIGGAYCIAPDEPLTSLYKELGLDALRRDANGTPGPDPVELHGSMIRAFWDGGGPVDRAQARRFRDYLGLVNYISKFEYPDIPLPKKGFEWILDLDRRSFRQDVEDRIGPLPPLLVNAINHYFYSSWCADWEEVSAAAGWNFVGAEPYGLWVFPEGMATMASAFHSRLHAALGPARLRTEAVVLDARPFGKNLQVTVGRADGSVYAIECRRAVMACPKFVCKHLLPSFLEHDPERLNSIELMEYRAYAVVNVLLNTGFDEKWFDLYLLNDGLGAKPGTIEDWHRPVDMVNGTFAVHGAAGRAALTFYWPVPYPTGRGFLAGGTLAEVVERVGLRFLPHLDRTLGALGLSRKDVAQVRMTRWGHPLPVSWPGFLAEGHAQRVREPIEERIFFAHQDNWALPAVENTLLDAIEFAPRVEAGL